MHLSVIAMIAMIVVHIGIAELIVMAVPHSLWLPEVLAVYVLTPAIAFFLHLLHFRQTYQSSNAVGIMRTYLIACLLSAFCIIYFGIYFLIYEPFVSLDENLEARQE